MGVLKVKTDEGFVDAGAALSLIGGGGTGGGSGATATLLCTLESEMSIKDAIEANHIPRKYEKSLVWIKFVGDNAATQGSATANWCVVYVNNSYMGSERFASNCFMFYNYVNSLVAPDTMITYGTIYGKNGSYITVDSDGAITSLNNSHYYASGTSIYYLEIPFDYDDLALLPLA